MGFRPRGDTISMRAIERATSNVWLELQMATVICQRRLSCIIFIYLSGLFHGDAWLNVHFTYVFIFNIFHALADTDYADVVHPQCIRLGHNGPNARLG